MIVKVTFNSLPASSEFCHLLLTFANSLDPDQDPSCLKFFLKVYFEKKIEKIPADDKES